MSLIEQLGGYEDANSKLLKMDKTLKEVYYSHSDAQKANELRQALLEHRRQHNIFEVGDKVVYQDGAGLDGLFEIEVLTRTGKPKSLRTKRFGGFPCGWCLVRHATDAEIEAGYRL